MNTAIQELIEWTNKYKGQMVSADQVVLQAHKALEKEKEQINVSFISGCIEALSYQTPVRDRIKEGYFEDKAEQYFNYTYNQKQHIIDIMKDDEDDGLYKIFDTNSDKKH